MARITKGSLDDALPSIKILDFSGGLNTMDGLLGLASNETPDCQNVLGFPDRLLYIGGTNLATGLPTGFNNSDGGIEFFDVNNNKHQIVWANGNMYDMVGGTASLIKANIYTPNQNIGKTVLNSILYWSTLTVPIRSYDGTTEAAVVSSGAAGSVAIPGSDFLCTYAGSIIAANPVISGTKNPGSILPSNTNDATTFIGANQANMGNNNYMQALIPMSVSAGGIPPTSSVMCLGTVGLVLAQGAVNAFKLQNINYPIGCKDGQSAVYIPTGDLLGNVIYLGRDNQFHESNGITTRLISSKILNLMNTLVSNAIANNTDQKFTATYNKKLHYYLCDLGSDVQMIYRWTQMPDGSTRAGFFKLSGWPSGVYFDGTSGNGLPTNYVASNGADSPGMYEVGLDGNNFNGTQPVVYWSSAYLHANDASVMKEYQWVNLGANNILPSRYTIDSTGYTNAANTQIIGNQITFNPPQNLSNSGAALWDIADWDVAFWGGLPALPVQNPTLFSKMLTALATDALGNTVNMPLRSSAVSFKIGWKAINSASVAYFDINLLNIRYKEMGHYMAGGAIGSAEAS